MIRCPHAATSPQKLRFGAYREISSTVSKARSYFVPDVPVTWNRRQFPDAEAEFHFLVMALSGNQLASSVTRMLFQRAWQTARFSANQSSEAHELTPSEHRRVYEAIAAGDAEAAEAAMKAHTIDSWHRRRLATQRDR